MGKSKDKTPPPCTRVHGGVVLSLDLPISYWTIDCTWPRTIKSVNTFTHQFFSSLDRDWGYYCAHLLVSVIRSSKQCSFQCCRCLPSQWWMLVPSWTIVSCCSMVEWNTNTLSDRIELSKQINFRRQWSYKISTNWTIRHLIMIVLKSN